MRRFEPGELPRTKLWQEVLHLLSIDGTVPEIAAATVRAASRALDAAGEDPAFTESFAFLAQVSSVASGKNVAAVLAAWDLGVDGGTTVVQILGALPETIRRRCEGDETRTEVGGLAVLAAAETLGEALRSRVNDLFTTDGAETERAFVDLGASEDADHLVPDFLGIFLYRSLQYFLSRETANRVGEQRRFACSEELSTFNRDLKTFCITAANAVTTPPTSSPADSWQAVLNQILTTKESDAR